ncbi:MAG: AI-2E family transporter [Clostridia bacterium]|nr:AI-2E family transporter [Clostridia bacterium]
MVKATPSTVMGAVCGMAATVYLTVGGRELTERGLAWLPRSWQDTATLWLTALRRTVKGYVGAMLVLFVLTFLQAFCGLLLLRQPYALLCALAIATVDALPVLGSGTILLPWALIRLLGGDGWAAAGLLVLYGSIVLVRQLAEPKLMGTGLGLHPVLTMLAMAMGLRLFGVGGMLLMPLLLSLGINFVRTKEFLQKKSL